MTLNFSKIVIKKIPHKKQRLNDVGDYFIKNGVLEIRVSEEVGFWESLLIAIHELIEVLLCLKKGLSIKKIDEWDMKDSKKDDYPETGLNPKCPYHKEHMIALGVEHILAPFLKVDWKEYEKKMDKLIYEKK